MGALNHRTTARGRQRRVRRGRWGGACSREGGTGAAGAQEGQEVDEKQMKNKSIRKPFVFE